MAVAVVLSTLGAAVRGQEATPVGAPVGSPATVATPLASPLPNATPAAVPVAQPDCTPGPATPTSTSRTVNQEIAVDLARIFVCLSQWDWATLDGYLSIPDGAWDPFRTLAELEATGLLAVRASLDAHMVRSTGPSGARVDVAWRVGSQLRFERWTFRRSGGQWLVTTVEPGVPMYDGTVVGFDGDVGADGVTLDRPAVASPGGVEVAFAVAPDAPRGAMLVVFASEACARAQPSPLVAVLEVRGDRPTLSLDAPAPGTYTFALVTGAEPPTREAICAAPSAVLQITP